MLKQNGRKLLNLRAKTVNKSNSKSPNKIDYLQYIFYFKELSHLPAGIRF